MIRSLVPVSMEPGPDYRVSGVVDSASPDPKAKELEDVLRKEFADVMEDPSTPKT